MATFGKPANRRIFPEAGFYDRPTQDIPANAFYNTGGDLVGFTTEPVKAGELGYFACQGTIAMTDAAYSDLVYALHDKVYGTATGQIVTPDTAGSLFLGYAAKAKVAGDGGEIVIMFLPIATGS